MDRANKRSKDEEKDPKKYQSMKNISKLQI